MVDTSKLLMDNLAIVKDTVSELQKQSSISLRVDQTCHALEILTDLCEEIDYANDFSRVDGFSIFIPLIECSHEKLIIKACELIAALSQNNPVCQDVALDMKLLDRLLGFVDSKHTNELIQARSYALYTISSIIRSNNRVRTRFERQLNGLTLLLKLLDFDAYEDPSSQIVSSTTTPSNPDSPTNSHNGRRSSPCKSATYSATPNEAPTDPSKLTYWLRKLRIRAIFLFRTLCSESQYSSQEFYDKKAIKLISKQLQQPQDRELREHLLQGLYAYLRSLDKSKQMASILEVPNIREVVANISRRTSVTEAVEGGDHYDLTDTRSICEELLTLIDNIQDGVEMDQQRQDKKQQKVQNEHHDEQRHQTDQKHLQLQLQ